MSPRFHIRCAAVLAIALTLTMRVAGQNILTPERKPANIMGTVTDVNGDTVPDATVVLQDPANERRTVVTGENGFFQFSQIQPGTPYQISVSAKDFAGWTSPTITLEPGQFKILSNIQLRIPAERTAVQVTYDPIKVATQQLQLEEKQRLFGIVPNFYVSYDHDAEPLTPKMKFSLALKVATDPITATGVGIVSAAKQAGNSPNYGQGWDAYGKRVGVVAADGFTDIMIGGAILPSLLHQDPRYFYQGTGTTSSRVRHAVFSPFITKGDNGKWEPNYSTMGGVVASSAIANLYYPRSNRGVGLVFGNFAIGMAERVGASVAQEFLLSKFTKRGGHVK